MLVTINFWTGTKVGTEPIYYRVQIESPEAILVPGQNTDHTKSSIGWCFGLVLKWCGHLVPVKDTNQYKK